MNKKRLVIVSSFLFFILFCFNLVSAEMLNSSVGVQYDSEIIGAFDRIEAIDVIIDLYNMSDRRKVLSVLSEDEAIDIFEWPHSPRINAKLTQGGFNKIIQDNRVKFVYYDMPVSAGTGEIEDKSNSYLYVKIAFSILILVLIYIVSTRIKYSKKSKK